MQPWARVAELTKVKTQNGGFVVRCAANLPFLLEEGMEVAFVPPRLDMPRTGRVVDVKAADSLSALVWFDTVSSRDTAEALCGSWVLVRRSDIPADISDAEGALEGFTVVDARYGTVGVVSAVEANPAHPLLCVKRALPDGTEGEVLIPWVDAFVLDVDEESKRISTAIPTGLLDV